MRSPLRSSPARRGATLLALLIALLGWPAAAGAAAAPACATASAYPGDAAGTAAIAGWMARGARAEGLPGELPVMAALVESGVRNLPDSGSGYAGFFQMSTELFDGGAYTGFARRPELQLRWFTETATAVREQRLTAQKPDPLSDDRAWGEWIADVERPAAQYRSRYQLRLEEARELIGPGCGATAPPGGGDLTLWGGIEQKLAQRVRVALVCATACEAAATGTLRLPASGLRYALTPTTAAATGGEKLKLTLGVPRAGRRAARRALRRGEPARARIDVSATDETGATVSGLRVVDLR